MEITNVDVPPAIMDNISDKVTEKVKQTVPPVVRIYATLFVDDSPDKGLEVNAINPLFIFVKHKEHLERNVDNIDMKHLANREFGQIVSVMHQS